MGAPRPPSTEHLTAYRSNPYISCVLANTIPCTFTLMGLLTQHGGFAEAVEAAIPAVRQIDSMRTIAPTIDTLRSSVQGNRP